MMEWQPIETAPKDGVFLVYVPNDGILRINVWPMRKGNVSTIGSLFAFDVEDHPTHWMPLPEPPR